LKEFEPHTKTLLEWIERTKKKAHKGGKFLGGNAATLLCALSKEALAGKNLSKANLTGANLSFADLRNANLKGTIFKDSQLRGAKFFERDMASAIISDSFLSFEIEVEGRLMSHEEFLGSVRQYFSNYMLRTFNSVKAAGGGQIMEFIVKVNKAAHIKDIKTVISTRLPVKVRVYADEITFDPSLFD
jgi:hypothetical protein